MFFDDMYLQPGGACRRVQRAQAVIQDVLMWRVRAVDLDTLSAITRETIEIFMELHREVNLEIYNSKLQPMYICGPGGSRRFVG
jgi:hypothetical protein